jgi:hypothetical protein
MWIPSRHDAVWAHNGNEESAKLHVCAMQNCVPTVRKKTKGNHDMPLTRGGVGYQRPSIMPRGNYVFADVS